MTTYTAYSEAEMTTKLYDYAVTEWGADWTVYRFDATKNDDDCIFAIYKDGWFVFGTESQTGDDFDGSDNGGTTGYWGYIDGELTFMRANGNYDFSSGSMVITHDYVACDVVTNSDGSVTISNGDGVDTSAVSVTIPDIGCIVGEGYNLSNLPD